jgi:hypothetical protein
MSCDKPYLFKKPKHPDESIPVTFDFSLLAGAFVSSPVITVTRFSGADDPSPGDIISGVSQVSGPLVMQRIVGGVDDCTYLLECAADDPDGSRWVISALLHVCAPPAAA